MTKSFSLSGKSHNWWSFAALCSALSYTSLLFMDPENSMAGSYPELGYNLLTLLWMLSLYCGYLQYLGATDARCIPLWLTGLGLVVLTVVLKQLDAPFVWHALPASLFVSYLFLLLAHKLRTHDSPGWRRTTLITTLVILSIHKLDYPFLRTIEATAFIGFLLAFLLALAIQFMTTLLALQDYQQYLLTTHAKSVQAASIDELTGLLNRRGLQLNFEQRQQHAHAHAHNKTLGLLFCDLDNFKPVNDQHGHHYGDQLLIQVARLLRRYSRRNEVVARYGGDEFIILLELDEQLADKQLQWTKQRYTQAFSRPLIVDKQALPVSVSMGCALLHDGDTSLEQLLQIADHHMYQAKRRKHAA